MQSDDCCARGGVQPQGLKQRGWSGTRRAPGRSRGCSTYKGVQSSPWQRDVSQVLPGVKGVLGVAERHAATFASHASTQVLQALQVICTTVPWFSCPTWAGQALKATLGVLCRMCLCAETAFYSNLSTCMARYHTSCINACTLYTVHMCMASGNNLCGNASISSPLSLAVPGAQ